MSISQCRPACSRRRRVPTRTLPIAVETEPRRGRDVVTILSNEHCLLPVLAYGIMGAEGVISPASTSSTAASLATQLLSTESREAARLNLVSCTGQCFPPIRLFPPLVSPLRLLRAVDLLVVLPYSQALEEALSLPLFVRPCCHSPVLYWFRL